MENDDSQGTLTLWFHENRDKNGDPSDKVFGVSNCHVLRENTATKFEHRGGAAKNHVRVCGMHRFQRGLDEITKAIADHGVLAGYYVRDIARVRERQGQDPEVAKAVRQLQRKLEEEDEAITDLEALHGEVTTSWSNIKLQFNIGHVQYAAPISVDEGRTGYTSDWAVLKLRRR